MSRRVVLENYNVRERTEWMKRYKCLMSLMLICSLISIGGANEVVQSSAQTAVKNVNGTSLGKLYKVRNQAETEERKKIVIKACVAGLYAIGDMKNAQRISAGLEGEEFVGSFMDDCPQCNGEGAAQRECYKCKGTGSCQNGGCHEGKVIIEGFNGYRKVGICAICNGTGKCKRCNGEGKVAENCRRCGGTKRRVNKEKALSSCKELLMSLTVSEKEKRARERADEEARLARERAEEEKRNREAREEAERRERREAEYKARVEAERAQREKERAEKKARQEKEREELAEQKRRAFEELEKTVASLPKSSNGWIRGVTENGADYAERTFHNGNFPPISIRVLSDGLYIYSQSNRNELKSFIVFGDINKPQLGRRYAYGAYLAVWKAVKKAQEWKEIAIQNGDRDFIKDIPVPDTPFTSSVYGSDTENLKTENLKYGGRTRFVFAVDSDGRPALVIQHADTRRIGLDLNFIDEFVKAANPIGAFEFLQKYDNLYN